MEYENNRNGSITAALTTGIIGTAGTALGLMGSEMGLFGNRQKYVTQEEAELMHKLAAKDSEIGMLKAESVAEQKMIEVYNQAHAEVKELAGKFDSFKEQQYGINTAQAVYNGTNTATIGCIQKQIEQLQGLTKLMIPNANVTKE